jgi:HEAT repeat protein
VPILLDALNDPDNNVRGDVVASLGDLGPAAKAAIPALLKGMETEAERGGIVQALGRIGPEAKAVVPALLDLLDGKDANERLAAAVALIRISPRHKPRGVAQLRKLMKRDEVYVWAKAAAALLRFSPPDETEALALLRLGLREETTRYWTASALCESGPEAKALVPELIALWKDEEQDQNTQEQAAEAVKQIDPAAAKRAGVP